MASDALPILQLFCGLIRSSINKALCSLFFNQLFIKMPIGGRQLIFANECIKVMYDIRFPYSINRTSGPHHHKIALSENQFIIANQLTKKIFCLRGHHYFLPHSCRFAVSYRPVTTDEDASIKMLMENSRRGDQDKGNGIFDQWTEYSRNRGNNNNITFFHIIVIVSWQHGKSKDTPHREVPDCSELS